MKERSGFATMQNRGTGNGQTESVYGQEEIVKGQTETVQGQADTVCGQRESVHRQAEKVGEEGGGLSDNMSGNGIDMERFGSFVTRMRKGHGLTQMQLAEKLYVSNKAVSKWERGQSLPDISLLEPLAETLGVTVAELLHGEMAPEDETAERELTEEEIKRLLKASTELTEGERMLLKERKRKRARWYVIGLLLSAAEMILLFVFGEKLGISLFDVCMDMLLVNPLILIMGIWPFFFLPEKLPSVYDKMRISGYSNGIFRINVAGIYFNNRNWPHIMKALRTFCFLMPVCWPPAYVIIHWAVPASIWLYGRIMVELAAILGGLFVPVVVLGKKYE